MIGLVLVQGHGWTSFGRHASFFGDMLGFGVITFLRFYEGRERAEG